MLASLVVGLGGTGSWTLAYLKQRLLDDQRWVALGRGIEELGKEGYNTYRGPIQLRALDVDRQNRPTTPGGVSLSPGAEDLALSGPIGKIVGDIQQSDDRSRTWPTIQAWLPKDEAMQFELVDAVRFMTEGAAIRQFGRISFFYDQLQNAQQLGQVMTALTSLGRSERGVGAEQVDLQVFIVGSIAGGAGAGLLVDVLSYLQSARHELAGEVKVRTVSFVVLPGAFSGVVSGDALDKMQASGRAGLRELDRLINAPRTVQIQWTPGRAIGLDAPASDVCYLLDGSRDIGQEAAQLEGHKPVENGLPVAVADAIYAHIFPTSGTLFSRDYPNLIDQLLTGTDARYSSFGSYTINYAWEPTIRSFGQRAVVGLVDALLASAESEGQRRVAEFLAGGATAALATGNLQQEVSSFVAEGFGKEQDASSLVIPGDAWLMPRDNAAPPPSQPNLADYFPGIGKLRTEYQNPDVVAQCERLIGQFWGSKTSTWSGNGQPGMHEALSHNATRSAREWKRALAIAAVALMNGNNKAGGLSAARAFLLTLIARGEQFSRALSELPPLDLASYQQAVVDAENEMNDNRHWDDAIEQRNYLDARQNLLEQEIADEMRRRVSDLTGRYLAAAEEVLEVVNGWRESLERLRTQAATARESVDNARATANLSPVQRYLPLPGDTLEQQLWQEYYGSDDVQPQPGLTAALQALTWVVDEATGAAVVKLRSPGVERDNQLISLDTLLATAARPFTGLRDLSVWELLERSGESAADLVRQLRSRGARFSVFDPNGQQDVEGNMRQVRDMNYAFAHWLDEGDDGSGGSGRARGVTLSSAVRQALGDAGFQTTTLAGLRIPGSLPIDDKIMIFTAKHLVAMESFPAVNLLDQEYDRRKSLTPSPHVLPEEKGAARLEAASVDLARQGFLKQPLDRVRVTDIALCKDPIFLQYVAACAAAGHLTWQEIDPIRGTGHWVVGSGADAVELGSASSLSECLMRVLDDQSIVSLKGRAAIESLGGKAASGEAGKELLAGFARDGWSPNGSVPAGLVELLQVSAAKVAAR